MLEWADQEEQEKDRFPHWDDNNSRRNDDSRPDRKERNLNKKRKPDDTIATLDRGQRGNKSGSQQDDLQKLLNKPCPLHPKVRHTILEYINLRKSLQEHPIKEDKNKKGKQNEDDNNQDAPQGFQLPSNTVNII